VKTADITKLLKQLKVRSFTEEGFTTAELAQAMGVSVCTATNYIRKQFAAGKMKMVGNKMKKRRDGRDHPTPAYKLVS
jgi:response regulator of citrate/malate metabolism